MKMPIPDDWNQVTSCRWAVCWPDSPKWKGILFGLLSMPSQGRFWDEGTGWIIGTQSDFRPFYDANFTLSEVIMACNDPGIAEALNAIAVALTANAASGGSNISLSCGGSGGTGDVNQTYCYGGNAQIQAVITLPDDTTWPIYGNQPIVDIPPGDFPSGYDDFASYDADKCAKANKMTDDFILTLQNISLTTWITGVGGVALLGAALGGLITVPAVVIPLILFALVANGAVVLACSALATYISENHTDFVCILYEGETVSTIIQAIADFLDLAIAALDPVAAVGIALKNIALWLMNGDTLEALFTAKAKDAYPDVDCSDCIPCVSQWDFSTDPGFPTFDDRYWNTGYYTDIDFNGEPSWDEENGQLVVHLPSGGSINRGGGTFILWEGERVAIEGDYVELLMIATSGNASPYLIVFYDDETFDVTDAVVNQGNVTLHIDPEVASTIVAVHLNYSHYGNNGGGDVSFDNLTISWACEE